MDKNTLEQLDYFKIQQIVSGFAMTVEGKEKLLHRLPLTDEKIIEKKKQEAKESLLYLQTGRPNAILRFEPVYYLFSKIKTEGVILELEELYKLGKFCKSVINAKKNLSIDAEKEFERKQMFRLEIVALNKISEKLPNLDDAEKKIFRVIDENGILKDLPEIKKIRITIQKIKKEIDLLIHSYTSNNFLKDILQSNVPVLCGERQVLAVKYGSRNKINGIVHDLSQSGQTVYLEPSDVVKKNNDLVQEEFRLQQEIKKILKALTNELSVFINDFYEAHKIILTLDCAFAVAKWCLETNGTFVLPCNKNSQTIILKNARHPLIEKNVVPINVEFLPNCRQLIISGPNTGGKTVTIKTIALFALLNQSGFSVPCDEGTTLPVFENIFVDIGDGQSLNESLSTFSAHMKNIALAINGANDKSLVLLDELGSGTDPEEGGAIAMAVLDELIEKKSFVLVTTHHGILKNYAYTHNSCTNASVEFCENTLSPTYKVLMGVPGESHAIEIAFRSGLNENIINKAKNYLINEKVDVSELIKGLTQKYEELNLLENELDVKKKYIADKWRKVDLRDLRIRQKENELRQQGYKKSKNFIDENRVMLENLVRELREGEITREKTKKVKETIALLESEVEKEKKELILQKESIFENQLKINEDFKTEKKDFKIGDEVYVGSSRHRGKIVDKGKNYTWQVQLGSMKIFIKENEMIHAPKNDVQVSVSVEMINESDNMVLGKTETRVNFNSKLSDKPVFELRLLGMRYEEAMQALQRQLDLCALNSVRSFSVIHGKGSGVLQDGVHKILSSYPGVVSFKFARPEDGDTGKTYVEM
ncbi:MAG: endonuclease MutS2 [Treponema sp.]|nr:endonuclease MutS2 [Treponema sp.]